MKAAVTVNMKTIVKTELGMKTGVKSGMEVNEQLLHASGTNFPVMTKLEDTFVPTVDEVMITHDYSSTFLLYIDQGEGRRDL